MPITSVGAIYATGSKLLQRIYIPHGDDSEIDQQYVAPGETIVRVSIKTYQTGGAVAVQAAVGTPAHSGICAVVDKNSNLVTDVIIADPVLYQDPAGNAVIQHDGVMQGDTWTGTQFTRRYVEINPIAASRMNAVVKVSTLSIDNPVPATAGNILLVSSSLSVGSALPSAYFAKIKAQAGG